jgi:hypothetical protein
MFALLVSDGVGFIRDWHAIFTVMVSGSIGLSLGARAFIRPWGLTGKIR